MHAAVSRVIGGRRKLAALLILLGGLVIIMLPLKPFTRSLAIFINICGQLYIAIIIALLIGKFAGESGKKTRDAQP